MPGDPKPFTFICGADDFLVGRLGKDCFTALAAEVPDEFAREVINGFAANVGEVEAAVNRFREAVQTISMFGGRRLVWLKDVNFLADSVTGRAEGTLSQVEALQELLADNNPAEVAILITASPVDRRRAFPKWCEKNADFQLVGGDQDEAGLAAVVVAEARTLGTTFEQDALALLLARVGPNTRLLIEETRKLATHADEGAPITEAMVEALTPNVAEGDFFETAEAFGAGNLKWTLAALRRHFFTGGEARAVIAALQNRNRLVLQVRALVEAGAARMGPRGVNGLSEAAGTYGRHFVGAGEKSGYNVFSQNAWYVGKLAGAAKLPPLRRLIDHQMEFVRAFEELIRRPREQEEEILREMVIRCLGDAA
jgi:DNA polymerase III subunit delta